MEIPTEKELKLKGQMKPKRGHKLFEYNTKLNELQLAKFEPKEIGQNKKVIIRKDCVYVTALNKKNAVKRLMPNHSNQLTQNK
jgi:hypothetical protein